jgi:polysaccharide biosynthesis/export protein
MPRLIPTGLVLLFGTLQMWGAQEPAPSKELLLFVRDAQQVGLKDAEIERNAVRAGWQAQDILKALAYVRGAAAMASETPGAPNLVAQAAAPPAAPAAQEPQPATPPSVSRGVPDDYKIGEGDVVAVSVWGEPGASVGGVVVRPDGKITMPLIKDIQVAGLTPAEAEKNITEQLSKQIKIPNVTVIVSQINSKKVFFVGGGIKKEGPIPYTYRMTIMQGISEAGGLSDYAKRKKIYVLRNENGRQYKLPFDYDSVLKGERMELNIPLLPGDTIVVPNR